MASPREQVRRVRMARQLVVEEATVVIARGGGSPELREALDVLDRELRALEEISQ